jgi:hypothetical protein
LTFNNSEGRKQLLYHFSVIIVMGGYDFETKTYLSSVECLDLSSNVWRELSPMTTKRSAATAVVKPLS